MKVFVIFLVIFAVTKASLFDSNFLTDDDDAPDSNVNFLSVNNLADFVAENPEAELEMMHMYSDYRGQINYVLGARQRGDRLVGTASNGQRWPRPQNVDIEIKYPTKGRGALVTYVSLNITQSTNLGRAYVTKGGIHQRNITIVVEAYSTTFVHYICNIFGM
uniref:18 kDa midgut protein n=1 Tax=Phlebotomus papatasi TaxID=29031 RepID=A8C9W4_PHLPP|nr:18 kDa midgut protein [Phlebotomus papatasi]